MDSKGQGISINVVIIAALALLVLVILAVILLGRLGIFSQTSLDCESQGGQCVSGPCPAGLGEYKVNVCPKDASTGARLTCCAIPK